MTLVRASAAKRRLGLLLALSAFALAAVPLFGSSSAAAAATCPTFRVLHNDRIGPAVFPAGTYTVTPQAANLSCGTAARLFTRFLEDWDGNLPGRWRVVAEGSGRASFRNGSRPGFQVALRRGGGGGGEGGNRLLGRLCPNTYTVNTGSPVGPLYFRKGQYLIYIPTGSGISCNRASVLFTRFLGQPRGTLPYPWRLRNQIAAFYKPAHPVRSSFRIEAVGGAGPR